MLRIAFRLVFCQNWKPSTKFAALICFANPHIHLVKVPVEKDASFCTASLSET